MVGIPGVQISLVAVAKLRPQADCSEEQPIIPHREIKDLYLEEHNSSLLQLGDFSAKEILEDSNNRQVVASLGVTKTSSKQVSKILVSIMNL